MREKRGQFFEISVTHHHFQELKSLSPELQVGSQQALAVVPDNALQTLTMALVKE